MDSLSPRASITWKEMLKAWARILNGRAPMLSIEITKECPLHCPGCYAYGEDHLGGDAVLRDLSDYRGDALVNSVLDLVRKHRPLHVSLVGGEPLVRHRELSRILPVLGDMGVFTLVVTSAVIPIPTEWMNIPRVRVAVSVDGLPEDHDVRRKPATYARILNNLKGRVVNVHWVITRQMLKRAGYLEEYVAFWNGRPEVNRIWVSLYSPQVDEESAERLTAEDRKLVGRELAQLTLRYPKLLMNEGIAAGFADPPKHPGECLFAKMSTNYSADLKTRVEPCVFGGTPDCSQCGCAISVGLHWIRTLPVVGPVKVDHFIQGSIGIGLAMNRFREGSIQLPRWLGLEQKPRDKAKLIQIES